MSKTYNVVCINNKPYFCSNPMSNVDMHIITLLNKETEEYLAIEDENNNISLLGFPNNNCVCKFAEENGFDQWICDTINIRDIKDRTGFDNAVCIIDIDEEDDKGNPVIHNIYKIIYGNEEYKKEYIKGEDFAQAIGQVLQARYDDNADEQLASLIINLIYTVTCSVNSESLNAFLKSAAVQEFIKNHKTE